MTVLRTPDERFDKLPGFPFEPHYAEIVDDVLGRLRIHYVDEGPAHGPVILCLHGGSIEKPDPAAAHGTGVCVVLPHCAHATRGTRQ